MQQPSSRMEKEWSGKAIGIYVETLSGLIDTDKDSVLNAWKEHFLIFVLRIITCRT